MRLCEPLVSLCRYNLHAPSGPLSAFWSLDSDPARAILDLLSLKYVTLAALSLLFSLVACQVTPVTSTPPPTLAAQTISLAAPRTQGDLSLEAAIAGRRSVRDFSDQPLTLDQLSQLLWAAQGGTDPRGFRAAPSAGALYPLVRQAKLGAS